MVQRNCREETTNSENPHQKAGTNREERKIQRRNQKWFRRILTDLTNKMTLKPVQTSGRSKMTSSIVITMNLEFKLYVPKEENIFHSTEQIWTRGKKTCCDYWNVDSSKHLSDSWIGFAIFLSFDRKTSQRIRTWSGWETGQNWNDCQARSCTDRSMDENR